MEDTPLELPGLTVELDKLLYHCEPNHTPPGQPHVFIYFLTIRNATTTAVTLLGRKWVIEQADGSTLVLEGDKIVGQTPTLAPGEHFSYNSYHVTGQDARAVGSFHGLDAAGRRVLVRIPPILMRIPEATA